MTMVWVQYECGCVEYYVLPFDDYTDAECYVLDYVSNAYLGHRHYGWFVDITDMGEEYASEQM